MRKGERVSRAAKRTGSQKARQKSRRGLQAKTKSSRTTRKPTRRVTMFKSSSWYQVAMQSIAISPRVAT
jgi:hypothetical protein